MCAPRAAASFYAKKSRQASFVANVVVAYPPSLAPFFLLAAPPISSLIQTVIFGGRCQVGGRKVTRGPPPISADPTPARPHWRSQNGGGCEWRLARTNKKGTKDYVQDLVHKLSAAERWERPLFRVTRLYELADGSDGAAAAD